MGPQPTVSEVSSTVNEDGSITVTIPMDSADAAAMTFSASRPQHGAVTGSGPVFVYHPAVNFDGMDSFRVTISDGQKSVVVPVFLTVGAVNDAPVAVDDSFTTLEDTVLVFPTSAVLANDYDVDSPHLTVTAVTQPTQTVCVQPQQCGGPAVTLINDIITYRPAHNFNGMQSFQYTVSDGQLTALGTVTVSVTPVNDAPVANDDVVQGIEDTTLVIAMSTLLANDFDVDGQTPMVTHVGEASHGSVSIVDTNVVYIPAANYNGDDGFTYTISDGSLTASAFVSVSIAAVDDAPVAQDGLGFTNQNVPVDVTVTATDVDSIDLTFAVDAQPLSGTVTNVGAVFTYTPNAGFSGSDPFTFTASDGTVSSAPATVNITVAAVDAPPVPDLPFQEIFLPSNGGCCGCGGGVGQEDVTFDLTVTATDPDSTTLTYSIVFFDSNGGGGGGFATLDQIGLQTFRYNRPANNNDCFFGDDILVWQVTDEQGQSATGEVVFFNDFI